MSRNAYIAVLLFLFSSQLSATTTICELPDKSIGIKSIGWDTDTGEAKIVDTLGDEYPGKVVLQRKHDSGYKINIIIEYPKPHFDADATELIVFPVGGIYRVIGVGKSLINGEYYLNYLEINESATCLSL